jgi:hypothetical protein
LLVGREQRGGEWKEGRGKREGGSKGKWKWWRRIGQERVRRSEREVVGRGGEGEKVEGEGRGTDEGTGGGREKVKGRKLRVSVGKQGGGVQAKGVEKERKRWWRIGVPGVGRGVGEKWGRRVDGRSGWEIHGSVGKGREGGWGWVGGREIDSGKESGNGSGGGGGWRKKASGVGAPPTETVQGGRWRRGREGYREGVRGKRRRKE